MCEVFTPQPVTPPEADSATCDGPVHLDMFTFADSDAVQFWRESVVAAYCASGVLAAELPIAVGKNWAIGVASEDIAKSIAASLGGSVAHAGDYCTPAE